MNRIPRSHPQRTQLVCIALTLALSWQLAFLAFTAPQAAFGTQAPAQGITRIHILPFAYTDAIVLESNGRFGIVDSGEDSDYPDGSDPRYPFREGITRGGGVEDSVISYLKSLGVNSSNLDFYLGTHPHSDHIGSADEIIREFSPRRVYISEYQDSFISDESRLWDNQYVYDRAIAAAKETGAILIQNLSPNAPIEPSPDDSQEENTLDAIGKMPEADVLDAGAIVERFGIDPTDQRDPYNSETLPDTGIAVTRSSDSNLIHEYEPDPSTTGNPCFTLGSMSIEIVNYGDDYKFNPVPDANYFSWGVKVETNGSTAFLSGDINNYDGDEDRLAKAIGHVDLLKLGHHGTVGSNTPLYLAALSPTYAIQTGHGTNLPEYATSALDALQIRYFTAPEAATSGLEAVIATFTPNGIELSTMQNGATFHSFSHSPHMAAYRQGLKQEQHGWKNVDGSWFWFDDSAAASENTWLKQRETWYWLTESGKMATGWAKASDGKRYFFESSGAMRPGGWLKDGGAWYYLSASGAMQTGWLKQGGTWYWLDPESGRMATGWAKTPDGTWYFFDGSGAMKSGGWMSSGGAWYYLSASGAMQTGWLKQGGTWYWLDPESGRMVTGWLQDRDTWYYLDPSTGAMATGSVVIDETRYVFDASGACTNR